MNFLKRAIAPMVQKAANLVLDDPTGWSFLGGGASWSGATVNDSTALQITSSFQAIRLISESLGTMPIHLYKRTENGREKATDHRLYKLIKRKPNQFNSSVEFREGVGVDLTCFGHSYAKLIKIAGEVYSIIPLPKNSVTPKYDHFTNTLKYGVTENGVYKEYPQDEILSIKGFGASSKLEGFAPHQLHSQSLGATKAAEEFAARFFGNGAHMGGFIEFDQVLKKEQRSDWAKNFAEQHGSPSDAHKWALLEKGMKAVPRAASNSDNQLIETRKHQIAETARIWNVPLSMLMEMDRATYSNTEQHNIQFVKITMNPYFVRFEEALNSQLLTEDEQDEYYFEFDTRGFLRGDSAARAAYYKSMRESTAITPNEIRRSENLEEIEGGDDLHLPLNYAPLDQVKQILNPDNNEGNES